MRALTPDETARFWHLVEQGEGCWRWLGIHNRFGIPVFRCSQAIGRIGAAGIAYWLTHGRKPFLRRTCRNPQCVNPNHLIEVDRHSAMYALAPTSPSQ